MKDKIKKYLINKLSYIYCDTCDGEHCEDCERKSMNWGISENYAECLASNIISMIEDN